MKLTKEQKARRKELKALLESQGGVMVQDAEHGITVLVAPCVQVRNGPSNFGRLAVAYTSPEDTFKRKAGELLVLERWDMQQTICVPMWGTPEHTADAMLQNFIGMFD